MTCLVRGAKSWKDVIAKGRGVLQHTATHCNTLQHSHGTKGKSGSRSYLATHFLQHRHIAIHCNALQLTATHCNSLYVRREFSSREGMLAKVALNHVLQHSDCNTLPHCNSLQHTAIHGSTLQHITTHCSTLQQRGEFTGGHHSKVRIQSSRVTQ